ncbi:MAG: hypothetical protein JRG91_14790 [Deltaproteobacteria bacterium]|nr:hypothetical protein [Deltaproteobacteria bacterium]
MMKSLSILAIPLALALASCGDDDDNDPTDTATEADAPDEVVEDVAEETVADAEPDPVDDPAPEVVDDPVEDIEDDSFTPSAAAEYFCTGYAAVCTYGDTDRFVDRNECLRAYDSWPTAQQLCAGNALGDSDCATATDPPTSC